MSDNMDLGRPDNVELLFAAAHRNGRQRATQGAFKTKVINRCTEVTLNVFYKNSRIKQYLKDGRALRIETVVNSPKDLRLRPPAAQPGRTAGRRRVRSTPGCCTLNVPARAASL